MASVNKVILIGLLGRDPEVAYTAGGLAVAKMALATNEYKKDKESVTIWHRVTAFGKSAEIISEYCKKGSEIYIEGKISYSTYEKNGEKIYSTNIIVDNFQLISKTKQNDDGQENSPPPSRNTQPKKEFDLMAIHKEAQAQFSQQISDDDIPF